MSEQERDVPPLETPMVEPAPGAASGPPAEASSEVAPVGAEPIPETAGAISVEPSAGAAEETIREAKPSVAPAEAVGGEAPSQPLPAAPEAPQTLAPSVSEPAALQPADVSSDDRLMAMLAWLTLVILQLPVLSVVLLLVETNKNRPFQRYHAVTSTIFWVVALIYEGLAAIVFTVLSLVTLGCLAACLWVIFFLPHLLALYYALQAYRGKYMEIPFISDFARRQGWVQ